MKRFFIVLLLITNSLCAQNKIDLTADPIKVTIPGLLIASPAGSKALIPAVFSQWITSNDPDSLKVGEGNLPANAQILSVSLYVETRYNSIDSTVIQVGHPADRDAYIKQTNCNSVGIKTNNNVKDGARVGKNESVTRSVYIYQNDIGSNATTGKVCITIWWVVIDPIP